MTDLSTKVRKLHAFTCALSAIAVNATTTEFPQVVREHIDVIAQEIDMLVADIHHDLDSMERPS